MSPTVPADSGVPTISTLRRPTPLALAAVECGVALDDVHAYVNGRAEGLPLSTVYAIVRGIPVAVKAVGGGR